MICQQFFKHSLHKMNTGEEIHTFEIKVHTGSSKRGVSIKNGVIDLFTPKRPVKGEANRDAIEIISGFWGVPKNSISIVRGETSKIKVVAVKGRLKAGKNKFLL